MKNPVIKYQIYMVMSDILEPMGEYEGKNPQDAINSMAKHANLVGEEFGAKYIAIPSSYVLKRYTPIIK